MPTLFETEIREQPEALRRLLDIENGLVTALATPSLFTRYGARSSMADSLVAEGRRQGAVTVAISDRDDLLGSADVALPVPQGMPDWLSPIVADAPPGLSKLTHTV